LISLKRPAITIAVRELVEKVLRRGDLRYDFLGSVKAVEGIRAHQKIQSQRPEHYQAEVTVDHRVDAGGVELRVTGRLDGVLTKDSVPIVEEIKSTRRSLDELEENPNPIHWAQAQCYAYLWALRGNHHRIDVQLTYMNLDSGMVREIRKRFDMDDLAQFFDELIDRYAKWVAMITQWASARDTSIQHLDFPFSDYRSGQRDMAVAVYHTIREEGHLLVQAATGIGKTMAALFPAIKALGEGLVHKVIFLTARTTGRLAAESTIELLRREGLKLKSVSLTAKDKVCPFPEATCTPDECGYARGYYDRIDQALTRALVSDHLTRSRIAAIAEANRVCPFEFSLELVNWSDCVICDYNYAFAPGVMLQRLFGDQAGRHAVLVDEAHNLVDRSRDMFSAHLDKRPILALRKLVKDDLPGIYRALGRINAWMAKARRQCHDAGGQHVNDALPQELMERLRTFLRQSDTWLSLNLRTAYREALLSFFFEASRFVRVGDGFDQSYTVTTTAVGDDLRIKLFCIDPAFQLGEAWRRCRSAVLFSATLTPAGYFKSILGCHANASQLNLGSPFPESNLGVYAADGISTFFRDRETTAVSVCRAIAHLVKRHEGNYLIYLPSYDYMELIHRQFVRRETDIETCVQAANMNESQRENFLERFHAHGDGSLIGFAVMGGIFGEGIDLKGECLCGAVIVGVGLPGLCLERDLIRSYYDRIGGDGFAFAYQYPGINRVLQAAGRVIRSETDQGILLLIDHRYSQHRYRSLLPGHWNVIGVGKGEGLKDRLNTFWADHAAADAHAPVG
jgi:DNA excision repair protein ERCC-2